MAVLAWLSPSGANAASYETSGPSDYYFEFTETSMFSVTTSAWNNQIDSMLWLYDSAGNLIASNDDYYGLDSHIEVELQPGSYVLRTGVCCGNPNAWYGSSYSFTTSADSVQTTSTTEESTTTTSTVSTSTPETLPRESTTTTSSSSPPYETVPVTTTTSTTTTTTVAPYVPVEETVPPVYPDTTTDDAPDPQPTVEDTVVATTMEENVVDTTENIMPTTTIVETEEPQQIEEEPINSELLEALTKEEAMELFESIDISELPAEDLKAILEAVQTAPEEVRQAFEESVNVFDGKFDNYIPVGSNITVGARRVVVGVTATLFIMPAPVVSRRRP